MSNPTLNTRTTIVYLFQGDDLDPLEELRQEIEKVSIIAVKANPARFGDSETVKSAVDRFDEFLDEAKERAVKLRLDALSRTAWRKIRDAHPPRVEEMEGADGAMVKIPLEADAKWGFNYQTLADDLVPACVAPGQFDSDAARDEFLEALSDGDWSKVYSAAVRINQGAGPDPFARLGSRLTQVSTETNESPARLG